MTDLNKVTARFGRAYERNKKAKDWLSRQQKKFFDALTEDLESHTLARKVIEVPIRYRTDEYVQKHYPGWRIVHIPMYDTMGGRNLIGQHRQVTIEEDPALIKHEWLNRETGMVYGRTYAESSPSLDDERLKSENLALWAKITEWPQPWKSLVERLVREMFTLPLSDDLVESRVSEIFTELDIQPVLKDFNKLPDSDLMELQEYLVPGPRTVRLVPPRKATEEELANV